MKKTILAVTLALIAGSTISAEVATAKSGGGSSSSAANTNNHIQVKTVWTHVQGDYYAARSSVEKIENISAMWVKVDNSKDATTVKSAFVLQLFDCDLSEYKISYVAINGNDNKKLVDHIFPNATWRPVPKNSVTKALFDMACDSKK